MDDHWIVIGRCLHRQVSGLRRALEPVRQNHRPGVEVGQSRQRMMPGRSLLVLCAWQPKPRARGQPGAALTG